MIISSGRYISLLLIIMFMRGSFKSGIEGGIYGLFHKKRVFVSIRNDLTTVLTVGCHSLDDNLGAQILQTNQMFNFTFKPHFTRITKFLCDFMWVYNNINIIHDKLLMYKYDQDNSVNGRLRIFSSWGHFF